MLQFSPAFGPAHGALIGLLAERPVFAGSFKRDQRREQRTMLHAVARLSSRA